MSAPKDAATVVGLGAAACAACCAGPIIGVVAALGLGAIAATWLFGLVGLVAVGVVATAVMHRRGTRPVECTSNEATVEIALTPTRVARDAADLTRG